MDQFDFAEEEKPRKPRRKAPAGLIWLFGAVYFLGMAACLAGYFAYVFINPYNSYNPFPPPTTMAMVTPPSATPAGPPTFTPAPPIMPSSTPQSPSPSATTGEIGTDPTATPTETSTVDPGGGEVTVTATTEPVGDSPYYGKQDGSPGYIPHADGCEGLYLAGIVFDIDGEAEEGVYVQVSGSLAGQSLGISLATFTGPAYPAYGPIAYEIQLLDAPVDGSGAYVQLINVDTGEPMSDLVIFDSKSACAENVILINFVQIR